MLLRFQVEVNGVVAAFDGCRLFGFFGIIVFEKKRFGFFVIGINCNGNPVFTNEGTSNVFCMSH